MVDYHKQVVSALNTILPTHYEMVLRSGLAMPCISYMELNNIDTNSGETLGYSRITYQVKVWGNKIEQLQHYSTMIDKAMRQLGFKRTASGELTDKNSGTIQKILSYEALAIEEY